MAYEGWIGYVPPQTWERVLSMDVGGATPNVLEWGAICPETQSVVLHNEVAQVTTDMRLVATLAKPFMKHPDGLDYKYRFMVGDYENRVALDEMKRNGIPFTNAVKQNKIKSVHRLSSYLHPNPLRPYPSWHPKAGQLGAPLIYFSPDCKTVIRELPQQKWKLEHQGASMQDELDRSVRHDGVDCVLYLVRLLPAPNTIPIPKIAMTEVTRQQLMSKLYWEDVKRAQEKRSESEPRKKYNPHGGSGHWQSLLGSLH